MGCLPKWKSVGVLTVVGCLMLGVGQPAAQPDMKSLLRNLDKEGDAVKGRERLAHAEKYLELCDDAAYSDGDRLYALDRYISYMYRTATGEKMWDALDQAEHVFRQKYPILQGGHAWWARRCMDTYITTIARQQQIRGQQDSLATALELVDMYESVARSNLDREMACLWRGRVYKAGRDYENAARQMLNCIEQVGKPNPRVFHEALSSLNGLRRYEEAVEVFSRGLKLYAGEGRLSAVPLVKMVEEGTADLDEVVALLPCYIGDAPAVSRLFKAAAQRLRAEGHLDEAMGYAKLHLIFASVEEIPDAVTLVGQCLTGLHGNPAAAMRFLAYQQQESGAEDGLGGLADVANPLPEAVLLSLEGQLEELIPNRDDFYRCLKVRGMIHLALGEPDEALALLRAAYAVATMDELPEAEDLTARVAKAWDCRVVHAGKCMLYAKHGPAGPDGVKGTADDLADPFAGFVIRPLPEDVRDALEDLAEDNIAAIDVAIIRGKARLALGQYREGLEEFQVAYATTPNGDSWKAKFLESVATAIKAFDNHRVRAIRYLLFQRYGSSGPDGKAGTGDDVDDPLPEVLKSMSRASAAKKEEGM